MKTLVVGCTGTVGSEVLRELTAKGMEARCMSRSGDKIKNLPTGAEGIVADMDKPVTLAPAFDGIDSVFLVVPVSKNETDQGLAAVAAARAANVKKIVYMSVYMPTGSSVIPHFNSKIPIETAVRQSGIAYTILQPNNFFQNDRSIISIITAYGIYPTPVGLIGLNRIDARDIADAAVNALIDSRHDGQIYSLHGADTLNGRDMAKIYSKYVGRDVRYAGNDLDVWVQHVKNVMPDWMYRDLRIMYKYFQDHGMIARDADLEKQLLVIGHEPRSFEHYAGDLAEEWKRSLACAA